MKLLITGVAGFIGYHVAKKAIALGYDIVGIDNLNTYYTVSLKENRLKDLGLKPQDSISESYDKLKFYKVDLSHDLKIAKIFEEENFDVVINLAAQAGVRYSITNPHTYIKSNAEGFLNILEGCRNNKIKHLVYASSSSVYGVSDKVPFSVEDPADHPVSLYAATKRSNELMAHTYSHLYGIPTTGLRYFTVYGPWGRPDMAPFLFTKAILEGNAIKVFNKGEMERDFTFVDDIAEATVRLLNHHPKASDNSKLPNMSSNAPFRIFNIGNSRPTNLLKFIEILESELGVTAKKEMLPNQPGDVPRTYADVEDLFKLINFRPETSLEEGIKHFVQWYRDYYSIE